MRTIPTPPEIVFHPGRFGAFCLAALVLVLAGNLRAQPVRPTITVQPQSQTVAAGRDVTFSVSASGTLPMNYSWRQNGTIKTNITLNSNTCVFTIPNVQTNQAGGWRVGITNIAGPSVGGLSSNAQLTVIFPVRAQIASLAQEFCQPANAAIDPGETVTVSIALLNTTAFPLEDVVATLLPEGGVLGPGVLQNFGTLESGGVAVARPFTFTANGDCGSTVAATLRVQDGTNTPFIAPLTFRLGPTNGGCCLNSAAADLALALVSQPAMVPSSDTFTVTATVTNQGPSVATGIVFESPVSADLQILSVGSPQGNCGLSNGMVRCTIETIEVGEAATILMVAKPQIAGTTARTTGSVAGNEPDFDLFNNVATATTEVGPPFLYIDDTIVLEGNSGTNLAVFNLRLSLPSGQPLSLFCGTAPSTATVGDYVATGRTLTFAPGVLGETFSVPVIGETVFEINETFFVNLLNPVNVLLADTQAVCTIVADDPIPTIWVDDTSVAEGNSGTVQMRFNVRLSNHAFQTVSFSYRTTNGTAVAGSDYTSTVGGFLLPPGITNGSFNVSVLADTLPENFESFLVLLSNPINATLGRSTAVGTILSDDGPVLSISDASVQEGATGIKDAAFVVTLLSTSALPVSVQFATADGTASAGMDYAATNGILIFSPGQTSQLIRIACFGDSVFEADEILLLQLSTPVNATLYRGQAVGTIVNDDAPQPAPNATTLAWSEPLANRSIQFMKIDPMGNTYVAGVSLGQIVATKFDPAGAILWHARHDGLGNPITFISAAALDMQGNLVLAGVWSSSFDISSSYFDTRTVLVKFGADGSPLWATNYFGQATALAVDASGSVYTTWKDLYDDFITRKLSPAGGHLWTARTKRLIGTNDGQDWGAALAVGPDGNVIVSGPSSIDRDDDTFVLATLCYTPNGTLRWLASSDSTFSEEAEELFFLDVDGAGNAYVSGPAEQYLGPCGGHNVQGAASFQQDWVTTKYDRDGTKLWSVLHNGDSNGRDFPIAQTVHKDGSLYVLGVVDLRDSCDDSSSPEYGSWALVRYAPNGTRLWTTRFSMGLPGELATSDAYWFSALFVNPSLVRSAPYDASVAVDEAGNAHVTINERVNLAEPDRLTFSSIKFDSFGTRLWTISSGARPQVNGSLGATALDHDGNFYLACNAGIEPEISGTLVKYQQSYSSDVPSIITAPVSQLAFAEDTVQFAVEAGGLNPLTYQWRFCGSPIDGATNASLAIQNVDPSIAGDYSVEIRNAAGACISPEARLTVLTHPAPQTLTAGEDLSLNVSVTPRWPVAGQWLRDGVAIPGATNASLLITNVLPGHAGQYVLVLTHSNGSRVSRSSQVTVKPAAVQAWVFRETNALFRYYPNASLALDGSDNVIVAGIGQRELLTTKLAPDGNRIWTASQPGSALPNVPFGPVGVAVDPAGNILVAGLYVDGNYFYSYSTLKYDSNGNELWARRYPEIAAGPRREPSALAVDGSGNAFVTGLPVTIKYGPDGTEIWVKQFPFGNPDFSSGKAIAIDAAGSAYVAGGSYADEGKLHKYDAQGTMHWAVSYDGETMALALDLHGNLYVTALTDDGLRTGKYGSMGNLLWTVQDLDSNPWALWSLPGPPRLKVDAAGNVIVLSVTGNRLVIRKYDGAGNHVWTAHYGGEQTRVSAPAGLALDEIGNVYLGASANGFVVAKFDPNGNHLWTGHYNAGVLSSVTDLVADRSGNVHITGYTGVYGQSEQHLTTVKFLDRAPVGRPVILSPPAGTNATIGTNVALTVVATGEQPLRYQWFFNGIGIVGATSTTLVLSNVQATHTGDYSVEVFNAADSITTPDARLTVQVPPTITVQPQNGIRKYGEWFVFSVQATSTTPFVYQWQLNGTNLPGATNFWLHLFNLDRAHDGNYVVVITNVAGAITSEVATLSVRFPPEPLLTPVGTNVLVGETIVLQVATEGFALYQWRKNGVNIPGAIAGTYVITNAQIADGGAYTVVIQNLAGIVATDPVLVVVTTPPAPPPGDDFAQRMVVTGTNGLTGGTNVFAAKEAGEPNHGGKPGGKSVWYSWTAPTNGIATFRTAGSTFDTLLGIYTGTNVTSLVTVDTDEDRGGFLTSLARFNAAAGTAYAIAIDGFAGASGIFALTWELERTEDAVPVIEQQPFGQTFPPGANALFTVIATGQGLAYQWYRNGTPLTGETASALLRTNVQAADVGFYTVGIRNAAGRDVESLPAALELVRLPKPLSVDKLEDLLDPPSSGGAGFHLASLPAGFTAVSLGTIDYQIINNVSNTTQLHEPSHCETIGGATRWIGLRPTSDGTFSIDTLGSAIDTVLSVYRATNLLNLASGLIDCDNDGAGVGKLSRLRFQATRNTDYLVVVDGVNYERGVININWAFGQPPLMTPAPEQRIVRPGEALVLRAVSTNGVPPPRYQWHRNGQSLLGATNDFLALGNLQVAAAGQYSVVVSNALGVAINTAEVMVELPYLTADSRPTDGVYRLHLPSITNQTIVLEVSADLQNWTPIYWHPAPLPLSHLDFPATNDTFQFFRARPWP